MQRSPCVERLAIERKLKLDCALGATHYACLLCVFVAEHGRGLGYAVNVCLIMHV